MIDFICQRNRSIEKLNLSWNGLYLQGAKALACALSVNDSLKDLDVTCNRMSEECLTTLLNGLKNNRTLEILRVRFVFLCPILGDNMA